MSTLYKNITAKRMSLLAQSGQQLFHTHDLALLFGIRSANTLRVTLHRLTRAGILYRIHRGLFSIIPAKKTDPVALGGACLHRFCYVTTETVLRQEGYILQDIDAITFASGVSRRFSAAGHRYVSRRLHPRFLQNLEGIRNGDGAVPTATAERAIADMLYFDPWYHFDAPVDWTRIRAMQERVGYPLTPHRYADPT